MIEYGHIELSIPDNAVEELKFVDKQQCYQQVSGMETYFNEHNSSIWQMFDDECPQWLNELALTIPQEFAHHVVSVIKLDPGQTVPYHVDKHYKLKTQYGDGESYRYLIFLEDWKTGHYYEIHDQPYTKWRKGDWVKFGINDWHLAGNMGLEPFYSVQITGIVRT